MQRIILCFMAFIFFYGSPAMAAEAILPIRAQIISAETWQKMQQSKMQTTDANHDAEPTAVTSQTDSSDNSFTEDVLTTENGIVYDTSGEDITSYQPTASDYTISKAYRLFNRLDTNRDSIITIEEYLNRGGRRATKDSFAMLDEDGNGWLSLVELSAF